MTEQKIDWPAIRKEWENEHTSMRRLAEDHGITVAAISKRKIAENWLAMVKPASPDDGITEGDWLPLLRKTDLPRPEGRDNAAIAARIVQMIHQGTPDSVAAQAVGIDKTTWFAWKKCDGVQHVVNQAKAQRARHRVSKIEEASDRGDWKASSYLVERDEMTRDQFRPPDQQGSQIQVVVNIQRGDFDDIRPEDVYNPVARVIDGEPVETEADPAGLPANVETETSA